MKKENEEKELLDSISGEHKRNGKLFNIGCFIIIALYLGVSIYATFATDFGIFSFIAFLPFFGILSSVSFQVFEERKWWIGILLIILFIVWWLGLSYLQNILGISYKSW